jgi:hypothetical protein
MRTHTQLKRFFAKLLISLTVLMGLVQRTGAGQRSGQPSVVPVIPADATGPSAPFFLPPVIYDPHGYGFANVSVAIADVNGDGKPDLLVANRFACPSCANGSVAVSLGNGDGRFQSAVTYDSGAGETESLAVADVNGDGKPDVVVGNKGGGGSSWARPRSPRPTMETRTFPRAQLR